MSEPLSDIFLTPHGLLLIEPAEPPSPWPDPQAGKRVADALRESAARGLLHLGTRELDALLPPVAGWWREFARRYLTGLCHLPDLEQARTIATVASPAAESSAVEKKNWIFIGRLEAGRRSAVIYSVIGRCRRRGIDPWQYVRDVLERIPGMNQTELPALLPRSWKPRTAPAP